MSRSRLSATNLVSKPFSPLFAALIILAGAVGAQATVINFGAMYDGSYDPYNGPAPSGQNLWTRGTATEPVVWNSDQGVSTAGVATFNDTTPLAGSTRLQCTLNDTVGAFTYDSEYTYQIRMKLSSAGAGNWNNAGVGNFFFGFRDEYYGAAGQYGKQMCLSWASNNFVDGDQPSLALGGAYNPGVKGLLVTHTNYFDDQWHTYTVKKYLTTTNYVDVSVDGIPVATGLLWSSLPTGDNNSGTKSFGWWGSSQNTYKATVDYFAFGTAIPTPEPATLVMLGIGLTGLLAYAWRKRR